MNLPRRLVKNIGYLAMGDLLGNLLHFIFFLYLAKRFGEAGIGRYSFAFSFTATLGILADLGMSLYLVRQIAQNPLCARELVGRTLLLRFISITLVSLTCLVFIAIFFNDYSTETLKIVGLLGLYQVFYGLADILVGEFKGHERMSCVALLNILFKAVIVGLGLVLMLFNLNLVLVLVVYPVGAFVYLIASLILSIINYGAPLLRVKDLATLRDLSISVIPFGVAVIINEILYRQDILILSLLKGDKAVGIYSVAVKIASLFLALSGYLITAIYPILSKFFVTSRWKLIDISEKTLKYLFMASLPVSAGLSFLAGKIITFIYQDSFGESVVALQIAGWTIVLGLVGALLSVLLTAIGRQMAKVPFMGINLVTAIILNFILIHYFTYVGAAIGTVTRELIPLLFYWYLISKYLTRLQIISFALRPALACGIMGVFILYTSNWHLFLLIPASGVVYFFSLILLGSFRREEINLLRKIIYGEAA